MDVHIGIDEEQRKKTVEQLNQLLADEFLLYVKTRNYHWNVTGHQFNDFHKLFEEQYQQLEGFIDDIAERVRTLGYRPLSSMKEYLDKAQLEENASQLEAEEMIRDLYKDHETIVRTLRDSIENSESYVGDVGTEDFLTGLLKDHEKITWMLRSILG